MLRLLLMPPFMMAISSQAGAEEYWKFNCVINSTTYHHTGETNDEDFPFTLIVELLPENKARANVFELLCSIFSGTYSESELRLACDGTLISEPRGQVNGDILLHLLGGDLRISHSLHARSAEHTGFCVKADHLS
jgi:hypothetical protein